jgi:putative YhdH/YhfP family quinone oxidoreductase
MEQSFRALRVYETNDEKIEFRIEHKSLQDLPEGNTLIRVEYSSLNYKDALSATGNRGVTREYPHTPGIDAAGTIESTESENFKPGDKVIVTGYDLGMNTWGGYSEYIRIPDKWIVPLPEGMTTRKAMELGTAGFTAGLSTSELLKNNIKAGDKILVTGATGGVGLSAVTLLHHIGCHVTAVTGKNKFHDLLKKSGAAEVIPREKIQEKTHKPLLKGEYDGALDVAGGPTLSAVLKRIRYNGTVTCCGLVDSPELQTTIYPFILRGIRLIGIDSAESKLEKKKEIWNRFATDWKINFLTEYLSEISMEEIPAYVEKILKGEMVGRVVVKVTNK